jgi:Fanconi anemia group M protein
MIDLQPRDYQKAIFETTKKGNTLVVLPTGLGKTLIALMLTIERQERCPGTKALILAPTRPLVEQHLESFKKRLPELFADVQMFTGSVNASARKKIWQTADIILSTPQCIANDLDHRLYDLSNVSLLVIDEAHRCLKNYDYTKVVKYYKDQSENQLILGLTASPGSEIDNIRQICAHLAIDEIEVRTRESEDVKQYLQEREFEKVEVPFPKEFEEIRVLLNSIWDDLVNQLKRMDFLFGPANKVTLLKLQNRLAQQKTGPSMVGMSITAQAIKISHAIELLETQTLSGLNDYLRGLIKQAEEKKSRGVQMLVRKPAFNAALISLNELLTKKIEHPKIGEIHVIIEEQFKNKPDSKVIIFTQFRETSLAITRRLNEIEGINATVFVGQAKKANTGLSQKEQKEVIENFKEGKVNVLCATSIGEEGLDIPEVSAVIFYEPIPSAVRKIQRAGRTARLKPGKLLILITKNTRDEIYHYASTAREKKMYKAIEMIKREIKDKNKNLTLRDFKG